MDQALILWIALICGSVLFMSAMCVVWFRVGGNRVLPAGEFWFATLHRHGKRFMRTIFVLDYGESLSQYSGESIAMQCCYANAAVYDEFKKANLLDEVAERSKNIVVCALGDEQFDHQLRCAGQFSHVNLDTKNVLLAFSPARLWGNDWPLLYIRKSMIDILMVNGEPVIHGLLHAYKNEYLITAMHTDKTRWKASGGAASMQVRARQRVADDPIN